MKKLILAFFIRHCVEVLVKVNVQHGRSSSSEIIYYNCESMDILANQCERLLQIVTSDENVLDSLMFVFLLDALLRDVDNSMRLRYGEKQSSLCCQFLFD